MTPCAHPLLTAASCEAMGEAEGVSGGGGRKQTTVSEGRMREGKAPTPTCPVPMQMWAGATLASVQICMGTLSPGADVAGVSPVPVQMWQG